MMIINIFVYSYSWSHKNHICIIITGSVELEGLALPFRKGRLWYRRWGFKSGQWKNLIVVSERLGLISGTYLEPGHTRQTPP